MNTATQVQGAADPDVNAGEVVVRENPRQVAIDAMTQRMEDARISDLNEAIAEDPGLAMNQAQIDSAIATANAEAVADGRLPPPTLDDGAASRTPIHPAPGTPEPLPAEIAADPLSEFVVMQNGQPMFKAKVNGEDKLIPLDQARRQIQIGTSAEIRMQQAADLEKRTTHDLQLRERDLSTKEQALSLRTQAVAPPRTPPAGDFSEEDLLDEAREIFNTAFSGTEEDAAKKLARTLSKLRAPAAQQSAPSIDENALVKRAAKAAVTAVQNVGKQKDVATGYKQFQSDYPDIMGDPQLYKMADDMTDGIERDNPDWKISQVMDEAGKRTRAWVDNLKGIAPPVDPTPRPQIQNTPVVTPHPPNRQERKAGLVRMPNVAAGAVHQTPVDVPETEQTPGEALADLKAARGQPV